MPYNFVTDSFTQRNFVSRLSSSEVRFYTEKKPFYNFEFPFGGLGSTYDVAAAARSAIYAAGRWFIDLTSTWVFIDWQRMAARSGDYKAVLNI